MAKEALKVITCLIEHYPQIRLDTEASSKEVTSYKDFQKMINSKDTKINQSNFYGESTPMRSIHSP
jgi:hypothetical protein